MKKIFSKEKYIRDRRKNGFEVESWADEADGEEVEGHCLFVDEWRIVDNRWCSRIPEIGDYVKLKDKRGKFWNPDGLMDQYIGAVVKVSKCMSEHSFEVEGGHNPLGLNWWFDPDNIERTATPEEIAGYMGEKNQLTVTLTFAGCVTKAELVKSGRVIKVAEALCNSTDMYSRAEGALAAVEQLFTGRK